MCGPAPSGQRAAGRVLRALPAGGAGGAHRRARGRVQLPAGGAGWARRRARGLDKPAALMRWVILALESRHQPLRQPERSPAATRPRFRTSGRRRPGGVFHQEGIGAKKSAQNLPREQWTSFVLFRLCRGQEVGVG